MMLSGFDAAAFRRCFCFALRLILLPYAADAVFAAAAADTARMLLMFLAAPRIRHDADAEALRALLLLRALR